MLTSTRYQTLQARSNDSTVTSGDTAGWIVGADTALVDPARLGRDSGDSHIA
jgi:hypothetical protein